MVISIILSLLLGIWVGRNVAHILSTLFVEAPYIRKLRRLDFVIPDMRDRLSYVVFASCLPCLLSFGIAAYLLVRPDTIRLTPFIAAGVVVSGFTYLARSTIPCSSFGKRYSRFFLSNWNLVMQGKETLCIECGSDIKEAEFGLDTSETPWPRSGEFGFCSTSCFDIFQARLRQKHPR